jgi:hypothetical protein
MSGERVRDLIAPRQAKELAAAGRHAANGVVRMLRCRAWLCAGTPALCARCYHACSAGFSPWVALKDVVVRRRYVDRCASEALIDPRTFSYGSRIR